MNYIDIGCLALVALGFLGGLIGKLPRKFFKTLFLIGSVVLAYLLVGKVSAFLLSKSIGDIPVVSSIPQLAEVKDITLQQFVQNKITSNETVKLIYESSPTLRGIVDNLVPVLSKVVIFFVLGLVFSIVIPFILGIVIKLCTMASKKGTAIKSLGLFGAINGAIFALVICSPIIFLSPVLSSVSDIYTSVATPKEDATEEEKASFNKISPILVKIQENVKESKVVIFFNDKVMTDEKVKMNEKNIMIYTNESGELVSMYEQLGTIAEIASGAGELMALSESLNDLSSLSPENVDKIFDVLNANPELGKELVGGALEAAGFEGIDLTNVDLQTEGETIKSVLEVMNSEEAITEEKAKELAADLANSELVLAVAESNEGMLSELDEGTKTAIQDELDAQLADPESGLSQEDYDTLMNLFKAKEQGGE